MAITASAYAGERDLAAMLALAHAFPEDNIRVERDVRLWADDDGALLGIAIFQSAWQAGNYILHPAHPSRAAMAR